MTTDTASGTKEAVTSLLRPQELERDVLSWRDTYLTRIDRQMTAAFPELERRLLEALEDNLKLVLTKRPQAFTDKVIKPEVEAWVLRVVEPIREEASRALSNIDLRLGRAQMDHFDVPRMKTLLLPLAAVTGGIGFMVAGYLTGVTTTFFFFTSVSWPLVLGGAGIGGLLVGAGVLRLAKIKAWLAKAFSSKFTPKLYEALIGEGYVMDGERHPSIRRELQQSIEAGAAELLKRTERTLRC